jgi:hypothetical protein
MKLTTRLAAGALMASLLAVPVSAEAKPVSKVRTEAVKADKSLDRVVSLAKRNRDTAAAKELRKYRRHLRSAELKTRTMRSATGSVAGAQSYGRGVRVVGTVADNCADDLSKIVDDVNGDPQVAIANAIKACIVTRERVVEVLTQLLDQVPAEARPYLAKVIAMLSSDGQNEVAGITDALSDPTLPTDVAGILTQALELATAAIDDAMARLNEVMALVPADVRPMVQGVLTMVTDQLHSVMTMVSDLLKGLFGGSAPTPGTGGGTGGLGGMFGGGGLPGLNLLQGMFGEGFPFNLVPMDLPFSVPGFSFAAR